MSFNRVKFFVLLLLLVTSIFVVLSSERTHAIAPTFSPTIPRVWDDAEMGVFFGVEGFAVGGLEVLIHLVGDVSAKRGGIFIDWIEGDEASEAIPNIPSEPCCRTVPHRDQ